MFLKYQQVSIRKYREEDPGSGGGSSAATEHEKALAAIQTKLDDANLETARLNAKVAESNKHTKAAEQKLLDAQKEKDTASGNFEELYKAETEARTASDLMVSDLQGKLTSRDLTDVANNIMMGLEYIPEAAAMLRTKISTRLKSSEDGVKVIDTAGNITVNTFDALKEEILGSAEYSFMLKGRQAGGGGANPQGDKGGGAQKEQMKRSDFEALNPMQRAAKMKGGKVEIID